MSQEQECFLWRPVRQIPSDDASDFSDRFSSDDDDPPVADAYMEGQSSTSDRNEIVISSILLRLFKFILCLSTVQPMKTCYFGSPMTALM